MRMSISDIDKFEFRQYIYQYVLFTNQFHFYRQHGLTTRWNNIRMFHDASCNRKNASTSDALVFGFARTKWYKPGIPRVLRQNCDGIKKD